MDYGHLLEHSFAVEAEDHHSSALGRLEYLADQIFDFTTYDGGMSRIFARKAVEVCEAITTKCTFQYIEKSVENYQWFLLMCNMPFFASRIDWGTSIRGAWWDPKPLSSCGLWDKRTQIDKLRFSYEEWDSFMLAVVEFAKPDMIGEVSE